MGTADSPVIRALSSGELDAVSGGSKAKEDALVALHKVLDQMELDEIDVEPAPHVPMKL